MAVTVLDERLSFSTSEACAATGLPYSVVDRWERAGVVWPSIPARGTGSRRGWSTVDIERLARIAAVVRHAEQAGLTVSYAAVSDMWDAIAAGDPWTVTLTA